MRAGPGSRNDSLRKASTDGPHGSPDRDGRPGVPGTRSATMAVRPGVSGTNAGASCLADRSALDLAATPEEAARLPGLRWRRSGRQTIVTERADAEPGEPFGRR